MKFEYMIPGWGWYAFGRDLAQGEFNGTEAAAVFAGLAATTVTANAIGLAHNIRWLTTPTAAMAFQKFTEGVLLNPETYVIGIPLVSGIVSGAATKKAGAGASTGTKIYSQSGSMSGSKGPQLPMNDYSWLNL